MNVTVPALVVQNRSYFWAYSLGFDVVGDGGATKEEAIENLKKAIKARSDRLLEIYKDTPELKDDRPRGSVRGYKD